jgi:hypothetical protein
MAIPATETHFISKEDIAPSSSRKMPASETAEQLPLGFWMRLIFFPKFNTTGRSLLIMFNSPREEQDPATYLKECITALTKYIVDKVPDRDLVGLRIRKTKCAGQGGWH